MCPDIFCKCRTCREIQLGGGGGGLGGGGAVSPPGGSRGAAPENFVIFTLPNPLRMPSKYHSGDISNGETLTF